MSDDANLAAVPPMLSQLIGIPSATGVVASEMQNGNVRVERELEGGALEVVTIPQPCVIAVQTGINEVRYALLRSCPPASALRMPVTFVRDSGEMSSASTLPPSEPS